MKAGFCAAFLLLAALLAFAQEPPNNLSPILDHVISPRGAVDLDGEWQASAAPALQAEAPTGGWAPARVPDRHAPLFTRKKSVVWFRRSFDLPEKQPETRYELCFERVTDRCEIFLNGERAGASDDGFFPFRIDATRLIRQGTNDLLVKVYGPTPETVPGRRPQGLDWLYAGYRGIPYPVHLETTGMVAVEDVFVISRLTPAPALEVRVEVKNHSPQAVRVEVKAAVAREWTCAAPQPVDLAPGESRTVILRKEWPHPHLWRLSDPHLYYLDVEIASSGKIIDAKRQRFGFRELRAEGADLFLNGVKTLQRRSSAIIYWNKEEARREEIPLLRKRGFNGYRLHLGPSLRMVRLCDELGWLVSPEGAICSPHADAVQPEFWPAAEAHLLGMTRTLRNSPSVFYWSLSNEFACYYMKGTDAQKADADARMTAIGKKISMLDPTRIWTSSGDGELGGMGRHGEAPALSFHYAWQPFKTANRIPATADWLSQGLAPWQGIVWDRSKPLILSEDLHPPYALKLPDGATQWAGDAAYDPAKGFYRAWFDAYRLLAPGYYRAGVSVWNPWATSETRKDNPLYAIGQLMPDFLIAPRELSSGIAAGHECRRTFDVFNQTDLPRSATLDATLADEKGGTLFSENRPVELPPGASCAETFVFPMPETPAKIALTLRLVLSDGGKEIAREEIPLSVWPAVPVQAPPQCALLSEDPGALKNVSFPAGRFSTLAEALATRPGALAVVKPRLDAAQAALLRDAVTRGLKVLILEPDPASALPVRADPKHAANFAFIRAPGDPAIRGFAESDLRLWQPGIDVSQGSFLKPMRQDCDVILECGGPNGLEFSPLLRLYAGRGYYLLCQIPVATSFADEPAAPALLRTLLASLNGAGHPPGAPAALLERGGPLEAALKRTGLPFSGLEDTATSPLLLVDGRSPLTEDVWKIIAERAKYGRDSMIDGITAVNAAFLSEKLGTAITLRPSVARQLLTTGPSDLSAGLSNGDLCWFPADAFYKMMTGRMAGKPDSSSGEPMLDGEIITDIAGAERPFSPAGLVRLPLAKARLVLSAICWDKFLTSQPLKSRAVIARLLRNQGCRLEKSALPASRPTDLRALANRGFWARPEAPVPAWFGDPGEDLRYFPVNVTGFDPELKMAQPTEKFPAGLSNYAGVDFQLIDPDSNAGRSCVVVSPEKTVSIPLHGEKTGAFWMLGALDAILPEGAPAAAVTFRYADGSSADVTLRAGVELNGYQKLTPVSKGLCAWTGPTPKRTDAVLWCWDVTNPAPGKPIASISLTAKTASLAVVAASLQQ